MDKNSPPDDHLHLSIFGLLNARASGRLAICILFAIVLVLLLVYGLGLHYLGS